MRHVTYGDADGDPLVFVLGWGNRPEHDGVQWTIDRLTEAGYAVTAFEIPRTIRDFESAYLAPIEEFVSTLADYRLLSHSTGGLIARYLPADSGLVTRTYLSPWWGFHEDLENPVVSLAMRLPVSKPILPASTDREDLGELASEAWVEDSPDLAAPTFLREVRRAQRRMPPVDDRDVVFYNPEDPIVGTDAVEEQAPAANRVPFADGHELFNSRSRDEHVDTLLAAIDRGVDALG